MSNENSGSAGSASSSPTAGFDPEYLRVGQRISETFTLRSVIPTALGEFPVWLAEDEVMGRQVCLHFVPAEVATDEELRKALREEVRKTRQLIHPNILRVHEMIEGPDWAAIVTDAYDGESLARQLQEAPSGFFESTEVQSWVQTVLETLKDVHSVPVLHRNLSPADLILSSDGRLLLSNFGTRRAIVDALRRAGVKEGKYLSYTSPQVLEGASPTVSDDLYSFGATLFHLLTGKRVFEGADVESQIRSERPPGIIELRHKLNRDGEALFKNWERTVAAALSKDPTERPVNVGDLTNRLGLGSDAPQPEKEAPAAPQRAAAPAAAAAAAAVPAEEAPKEKSAPQAPKKEALPPEHMGVAGDEEEEERAPQPASERVAAGPPRTALTSYPPEPAKGSRKMVLMALLMAAGVVGAWFGASFFLDVPSPDSDDEDIPMPKPLSRLEQEASDGKFIAPAAPGSAPELTALRPGSPSKVKPSDPDALDPELLTAPTPLAMEPPKPTAAPQAPGPLALNTQTPPPPLEEPEAASKQALEAARKKAEAAKKEQEALAKKEQEALLKKEQDALAKKEQELLAAKERELLAKREQEAKERQKAEQAQAALKAAPPKPDAPLPPADVKPAAPAKELAAAPEKPGQFVNSLGMKFVPVGNVQFSVNPTRVEDYAKFIKETGYPKSRWKNPGFEQGPDHPVVMVSWTDALSFCKWLTDKEHGMGVLPPNEQYRLPTDQEWSQAVGLPSEKGQTPELRDMGVQDMYPWGPQWPPPKGAGNYTGRETGGEVSIPGYDDGYAKTSPVGAFQPNAQGLHDMGGNVWQWCMDTWNPKARSRVLRGASFSQGALQISLLSSCRIHSMPDRESDNYGFRVVRSGAGASKAR